MIQMIHFLRQIKNRFVHPAGWVLAGLLFAQGAQGAMGTWSNPGNDTYTIPNGPVPPMIDATNFYNNYNFIINFSSFTQTTHFKYRTYDTLNFTNDENGTMTINAPVETVGINGITVGFLSSADVEYEFDYAASSNPNNVLMAGTFYNQGFIRCDSSLDGNNAFFFNGGLFFGLDNFGLCIISATNIINPGNIDMSVDGQLQMTGNNVNLSRGTFTADGLQAIVTNGFGVETFNTVNLQSTGGAGVNTNVPWSPGGNLKPTSATGSFPQFLKLTNSTPYFSQVVQVSPTATNVIIRAVFVQNNSPNAPYNVYLDDPNFSNLGIEPGSAHVEWVGSYVDPATGNSYSNYLYLTDDYVFGATTNVQVLNGVPDNFSFITSPTPLLAGPVPAGFPFPDPYAALSITNPYAYFNGQIIDSSIATNNPPGSLMDLPGRVQITANNELNLQNAIITGQNYLAITATNQFDGSAGADIAAPYSDLNLAVTNGMLAITNLLESAIPNWSGSIAAWSTRWTNVDATTGISYDYRVLLVASQLTPTTIPWVQNLQLYSANSLVVSDELNVFGSLNILAQNLTITTNGIGNGATSTEGQLNSYIYGNNTGGNIGPLQMPNLVALTNNGSMLSQGQFIFTNANNYRAVINNGFISDQGTLIYATNFLNSGAISNSSGNMTVISTTTTLTNGYINAGGNVSITANSLTASNVLLQCLALTLNPASYLSDLGVSNGNVWVVGRANATGGSGFTLLNNPTNGDLLGTTITNLCPPANKQVVNTWAGRDFGAVNNGYTNNAALGRLILDVQGNNSLITFNGTGRSNALYVDSIEFRDVLTNGINNNLDFTPWLSFNTNLVIYFAQAYISGISVAEKINTASLYNGKNGGVVSNGVVVTPGRLRWVPTYTGNFSSTNIVVNGVTNTYNAALAQSRDIDSNGNGTPNAFDPAPFFTPQNVNFTLSVTNSPVRAAVLTWDTVPFGTNYVYYTGFLLTNKWLLYTNFPSTNVAGPSYPVTVTDTNILRGIRFYKVLVQPWLTYPY